MTAVNFQRRCVCVFLLEKCITYIIVLHAYSRKSIKISGGANIFFTTMWTMRDLPPQTKNQSVWPPPPILYDPIFLISRSTIFFLKCYTPFKELRSYIVYYYNYYNIQYNSSLFFSSYYVNAKQQLQRGKRNNYQIVTCNQWLCIHVTRNIS